MNWLTSTMSNYIISLKMCVPTIVPIQMCKDSRGTHHSHSGAQLQEICQSFKHVIVSGGQYLVPVCSEDCNPN